MLSDRAIAAPRPPPPDRALDPLGELARATPELQLRDSALVAYIVERHHAYARRALPYIVPLLAKVASFDGRRNANLGALCDAGHELADALEAHLDDEERDLFPALLARDGRREVVHRELERMYRHHRDFALLLGRIRSLAGDYRAPEWASLSYRTLMEELEALDEDLTEHMHLENFALVPRDSRRCREA